MANRATVANRGPVYDMDMPQPPGRKSHNPDARGTPQDFGYDTLDAWLAGIKERRAANPTKDEIQAALTAAMENDWTITRFAADTGIIRQQLHQGKYKFVEPLHRLEERARAAAEAEARAAEKAKEAQAKLAAAKQKGQG